MPQRGGWLCGFVISVLLDQKQSQPALPFGLCRTQHLCFLWCENRPVSGPQAERERRAGVTGQVGITHVTPAAFPPPSPHPRLSRELSPSIRPLRAPLLSFGCRERTRSAFPQTAQCEGFAEGFLLSWLSFLRMTCGAGFNLGINLTKVQNPLLCMENALRSLVYLSFPRPFPLSP